MSAGDGIIKCTDFFVPMSQIVSEIEDTRIISFVMLRRMVSSEAEIKARTDKKKITRRDTRTLFHRENEPKERPKWRVILSTNKMFSYPDLLKKSASNLNCFTSIANLRNMNKMARFIAQFENIHGNKRSP